MKIIKIFFMMSLLMAAAGCSKDRDVRPQKPEKEAWTTDESLRVPIRFGSSAFATVTRTMVGEWSDMEESMGIFALNLNGEEGLSAGSYDIYLDNEPASCVYDDASGKDMIQFEGGNRYYPYSSDRNLTFMGYYPYFEGNEIEYASDAITVPIPKDQWGKHDIMCASSFAERMYVKLDGGAYVPAEKDVDATAYYDGFNATYMRYLYRNGMYEDKIPHLLFQHKTTCFMFEAYLKEDSMAGTQIPVLQSIEITGLEIYDEASLVIARTGIDQTWTGELVVGGNPSSVLKIGGQNAGDLNAVPDASGKYVLPDYQFFLQPMTASSELSIKVTLENPDTGQRMAFVSDIPKVDDIDSFLAGHYYPFTITINHFTGIEISAAIEPWQPGWSGGEDMDAIGEDRPSGTL